MVFSPGQPPSPVVQLLSSIFGGTDTAPLPTQPAPVIQTPVAPQPPSINSAPSQPGESPVAAWLRQQGLSIPQTDPETEHRRALARALFTFGGALGSSTQDFLPALSGALSQGGNTYLDAQDKIDAKQSDRAKEMLNVALAINKGQRPTKEMENYQYSQDHPQFSNWLTQHSSRQGTNPGVGFTLSEDGKTAAPIKGGPADPEAVAKRIASMTTVEGSPERARVVAEKSGQLKDAWNRLHLGDKTFEVSSPEEYQKNLEAYNALVEQMQIPNGGAAAGAQVNSAVGGGGVSDPMNLNVGRDKNNPIRGVPYDQIPAGSGLYYIAPDGTRRQKM